MKDWMSHLLWYGNASVLKSVQSDLKLISPFHFFFLLFLAREKITSVFLSLGGLGKKKKTHTILLPKIAYRISKSDLFPNIAELMVVMGYVSF